ncbi:hypothetical protein F6B41_05100 [Microbacterium lushaniae]|nr:hypothetical protein F6B41_09500 [Microbacterium lushaniae]KAA9157661.1 hypothetical protein F6B41_05100 [Microbacterium lushaniae]
MSMSATFASLRVRIVRHGPNDERGFGLITGLVAAAGVVAVAVFGQTGLLHPSWFVVAVSVVGATWLFGPILLPGSSPILDPQWFRTLPRRPISIARAMTASEAIGVGTLLTAVALTGMIVVAAPAGPAAMAVAVVAAAAQLFFLLWLGRCAAASATWMLRSTVGTWVAAGQMSAVLAISFAGWVPLAAVLLPKLGEGRTDFVTPPVAGAPPAAVEDVLLALPTGWGVAAVLAATSSGPSVAVVLPITGLVAGGLVLCAAWIALTAHALRRPPARTRSNIAAGRWATLRVPGRGAVPAVADREIRTWFRDPHRRLGLAYAWITPLLMIVLVAPTSWSFALPFVGVAAAALGAMVAVNNYALDGTALWQLLTTPGAIRADVRGRQFAWMLLFGVPLLALTIVLCLVSRSPLWAAALGMTLAATGAACAGAPLLASVMPAIGADARERVSTASYTGNAAGGQWTIFAAVAAVAVLPPVVAGVSGAGLVWPVHLALGAATCAGALLALPALTRAQLQRSGPALLSAMAARDTSRLRR